MKLIRRIGYLPLLVVGLAACAAPDSPEPQQLVTDSPTGSPASTTAAPTEGPVIEVTAAAANDATPLPGNLDGVWVVDGDEVEYIDQLLARDAIRPVYDPMFISADAATLYPDELVMGVEINGDARAYPVGMLRSREMVDDVVGGTPILVTW